MNLERIQAYVGGDENVIVTNGQMVETQVGCNSV